MIDVEIVVVGALGDLVLSTLPGFAAERRLFTRLVVPDQTAAGHVLARLEAVGLEVVAVTELAPRASSPEGGRSGTMKGCPRGPRS